MKVRVTTVSGRVVALKSVNTRLTLLFDSQRNTLALYGNSGTLQGFSNVFQYGEQTTFA